MSCKNGKKLGEKKVHDNKERFLFSSQYCSASANSSSLVPREGTVQARVLKFFSTFLYEIEMDIIK